MGTGRRASPGESWAGAESECWPRGGSRPDPAACLLAWRDVWPSARWRLRGTLGVSGGVLIIIIADRNTGARRRWGSPESPWTPETPNQSPDQTPTLPAALLRTLPSRAQCRHADWGPGQGASWGRSPGAAVGQRASPKGCPENIRVPFLGSLPLPGAPGPSPAYPGRDGLPWGLDMPPGSQSPQTACHRPGREGQRTPKPGPRVRFLVCPRSGSGGPCWLSGVGGIGGALLTLWGWRERVIRQQLLRRLSRAGRPQASKGRAHTDLHTRVHGGQGQKRPNIRPQRHGRMT